MQAYTYSIKYLPTGEVYYGVRKSPIEDIGISYFSSSKTVKRLIQNSNIENFEFKVRRRFYTYSEARKHETRFLQRICAVTNIKVLNKAISGATPYEYASIIECARRQSISETMKKLWQNPEYKSKSKFINNIPKEDRVNRGRLGAEKRAENYKTGKTLKKEKKKAVYKLVAIMREDVIKTVFSNQVPQYKKSGWNKVTP